MDIFSQGACNMSVSQECLKDWGAVINRYKQHGRHREPFANTTQSSIEHMRKRWRSFCLEAALGEPQDTLQNIQAPQLKGFLQWMIENAERSAPQVGTLKQYFRILKMIYKRATGGLLDEDVVCDVNAVRTSQNLPSTVADQEVYQFIQHYAEGKGETLHRPKPVPSGADPVKMLHFLYANDKTKYPDERQRVQQAFLIIIHAYSGLRPSSVTQSSKGRRKGEGSKRREEAEEIVKLRYRDMALLVSMDEQKRTRFAVEAVFKYFKGGNRRPQRKTFVWADQADILTCPVAHLVALALHDEAFQLSLNSASSVFSLSGEKKIRIPWRDDILDKPVLRASNEGPRAELQDSVSSKRLKHLGEQMGYPDTVTWYWLRRLVLNAIDGCGSEEVRNQVAGHLDSKTYRNHYQDQRISLDVASLVLGHGAEDTLMQNLDDIGTDADPDANIALPAEAVEHIATLPDVVSLERESCRLTKYVKDNYGNVKDAPTSAELVGEYIQARNAYRAKKEFHKARMRSQLRKDFFANKAAVLIEAQLNSDDAHRPERTERKVSPLSIPGRAALANLIGAKDMRSTSMQAHRAAAVQMLADLCCRAEPRRNCRRPGSCQTENCHEELVQTKVVASFSMKCHHLQCLFCIGDQRLYLKERMRKFSRQYSLGVHVENQINALKVSDNIPCPHPICKTLGVTVSNVEHLKNHAYREHGIRLQTR